MYLVQFIFLTVLYKANAKRFFPSLSIRELSRFIAAGRLHCKIDKVNEGVETNRYVSFCIICNTCSKGHS